MQTGTSTGRLSSQSPNLQNIPRESSWSPELRSAFEASEGYTLAAFDYSQIELRLVAALSEDPGMLDAFNRGLDVHTATASRIFNVEYKQVKPEMRRVAKTLNFGLIYGMGSLSFARASGRRAAEFIGNYFQQFPKIKEWQDKVKQEARLNGYVKTLLGRRRYFPNLTSRFNHLTAEAEREAINMPIQGLDADINKLAMIAVKKCIDERKWWMEEVRLLLSVHDELLFEIHDDKINEVVPIIKKSMEDVYHLRLPLVVDVSLGKNWGNMKSFNFHAH